MREVQKKMKPELFDMERLIRIDALRMVIEKSCLIPKNDRELITDALYVHAKLIKIFEEAKK